MGDEKAEKEKAKANKVTVYATDLLHEDGQSYQAGDPLKVDSERAARLVEIGICSNEKPAPAAPSPEQDADYHDKMMRLGKG